MSQITNINAPTNGSYRPKNAAIQVICLGSGGGPSEDNVTGLLVRSTASGWVKGSLLAVDAGSHLAAMIRILEKELPLVSRDPQRADSNGNILHDASSAEPDDLQSSPPNSPTAVNHPIPVEPIYLQAGPFAGVPLPHASARANAAHLVRNHVSTYLITHPHLDHLAGFAMNTAAFHATSRPKTLAALPFTVDAIKKHIFNDVIWPNLTDEDGGVGFVTFQRLKEGGDVMVGEGEGRGYIEVCEGLGAKGFKISHGKCMNTAGPLNGQRGSVGNISDHGDGYYTSTPRLGGVRQTSLSFSQMHLPETPSGHPSPVAGHTSHPFAAESTNVVDSTAYFVRDSATTKEVLIFGDVEPDSISLAPRLARVWTEAAHKIAAGLLRGIFIECSYDDSQVDAVLFGHLAPRHLVAELQVLAGMVKEEKAHRASERAMRKRKRAAQGNVALHQEQVEGPDTKRVFSASERSTGTGVRRISLEEDVSLQATPIATPSLVTSPGFFERGGDYLKAKPVSTQTSESVAGPLEGLRVIVIHIKDTMKDGPHNSELILSQLEGHANDLASKGEKLGCEFVISQSGHDYWF